MIIIALGSNLPSKWGNRIETLNRAVTEISKVNIQIISQSHPYYSRPLDLQTKQCLDCNKCVGSANNDYNLPQNYYINLNILIQSHKCANQLLYCFKKIEGSAGRHADTRWASRPLDIDLICYNRVIIGDNKSRNHKSNTGYIPLSLPHPAIASRAFVLRPIIDIAPMWHHPINGKTAKQMINQLK